MTRFERYRSVSGTRVSVSEAVPGWWSSSSALPAWLSVRRVHQSTVTDAAFRDAASGSVTRIQKQRESSDTKFALSCAAL